MIPLSFFQHEKQFINNHAYKDWVVEKTAANLDENLKTNDYLSQCSGWADVVETTGYLHRADNWYIKFQATPEYFLCWFYILVLSGGHFGYFKK